MVESDTAGIHWPSFFDSDSIRERSNVFQKWQYHLNEYFLFLFTIAFSGKRVLIYLCLANSYSDWFTSGKRRFWQIGFNFTLYASERAVLAYNFILDTNSE